jgi:hypothetical protein
MPADELEAKMERVFELVASGMSAHRACEQDGTVSWPKFWESVNAQTEEGKSFATRYARAQAAKLDLKAETLSEIAHDGRNDWMEQNDPDNPGYKLNGEHVQRSKLRVDTEKWLLSKLAPRFKEDPAAGSGGAISAAQMQAWFDEVAAKLPV